MMTTSIFTTSAKEYALKVDRFVCNKFGIAEFFARTFVMPDVSCKNVLDVGCGAGPLMVFLADQYRALIDGVEMSVDACRCCRANLSHFGMLNRCDVFEGEFATFAQSRPCGCYDLIVSNPPLDANVQSETVAFYNAMDRRRVNSELFSYRTNSWHDNNGDDLLDQTLDYSIGHLKAGGRVVVSFCEIDGVELDFVTAKGIKRGFRLRRHVSGSLPPDSIGVRGTHTIIGHYVEFERT